MNTDGNNYKMKGGWLHPWRAIKNAFKYWKAEHHRNVREANQAETLAQHWERIRTANYRAINNALANENKLVIEGQKAHTANQSARVKDAINVRQEETARGFTDRPQRMRFQHDPWQDALREQLERNRRVHDTYMGTGNQPNFAPLGGAYPQRPPQKRSIWRRIGDAFRALFGRGGGNNNNNGTPPPQPQPNPQ